jgi:hypothetical protein
MEHELCSPFWFYNNRKKRIKSKVEKVKFTLGQALKTDFGAGFGWVVNATPPPGFNPWTV